MESERLRNALLAAISHDVRTPLTALIGLAESLQQSQPPLQPAQADAAHALAEQARELNALVNNLLEMARLQSGEVNLRMEWQSVEEVVGAAIRASQPALGGKAVHTDLPRRPAAGRVRRGADRAGAGQSAGERRQVRPPAHRGQRARDRRRARDQGARPRPGPAGRRAGAARTSCSTSSRAARPNRPRRVSGWAWPSARRSWTRTGPHQRRQRARTEAQNSRCGCRASRRRLPTLPNE